MSDLISYLSDFLLNPSNYIISAILVLVWKHDKCLTRIDQWRKDHEKEIKENKETKSKKTAI